MGCPQSEPLSSVMKVKAAPTGALDFATRSAQRMTPDEAGRAAERDHDVDEERHPRRRHVDENDPVCVALLIVRRRYIEAEHQGGGDQRGSRTRRPWIDRARNAEEARRVGEEVDARPAGSRAPRRTRRPCRHLRPRSTPTYSTVMRSAAAAASGPSASAPTSPPAKIARFARTPTSSTAPSTAPTPNMRTGT